MGSPFEVLGLRAWADPEEIRGAYRRLVKQCHPDMVQDPAKKAEAQERMIQLNLAYEEALRLATPRQQAAYSRELPLDEAVTLARRMLQKDRPEAALRQLMRAESRDAVWFDTYGRTLMRMEHYHEAHQAYREAVRMDPENNQYRAGALEAAVAEQKEKTLTGRIRKAVHHLRRRDRDE